MTIVGVILVIIGGGAAGLIFTGNAPEQLANLPLPFAAWIGIAIAGLVLIYFNRRPGN